MLQDILARFNYSFKPFICVLETALVPLSSCQEMKKMIMPGHGTLLNHCLHVSPNGRMVTLFGRYVELKLKKQ